MTDDRIETSLDQYVVVDVIHSCKVGGYCEELGCYWLDVQFTVKPSQEVGHDQ